MTIGSNMKIYSYHFFKKFNCIFMKLFKSFFKKDELNFKIKLKIIFNIKLSAFFKKVSCFSIIYLISLTIENSQLKNTGLD